jgi:hypothetical protein
MIGVAVSFFVRAWLISAIALVVGRYAGPTTARFPRRATAVFKVYLLVWIATAVSQLAFSSIGVQMQLQEHIQSGFAQFLLPIAVGAVVARQLLHRETRKNAQQP